MDKARMKTAFFGDSLTEGIVGASFFDIIRNGLPQHEMFNYGKGGDTVISLSQRLQRTAMASRFDLGFLWIGVNDIFVKTHWFAPTRKRMRRQPWAKSHSEFRKQYASLLEFLKNRCSRVFTLPPLFIGEDIHNPWNEELASLSKLIQELSLAHPLVDFIDIRRYFLAELVSKKVRPYVPKNFFRMIRDTLVVESAEESEKRAAEKGFHFTIDGVHLNKRGAGMVAGVLIDKIKNYSD